MNIGCIILCITGKFYRDLVCNYAKIYDQCQGHVEAMFIHISSDTTQSNEVKGYL